MPDEVVPHWSAALPDPIKAHITNRGHDKEEATVAAQKLSEAHYAAQKLIGVSPDQVVRLPKDASDPSYIDAYKRVASLGVPAEAAGYTFEGVPEATATKVRELAHAMGLPTHVAAELATRMVADDTAATARAETEKTTALGAMQATLRANWGANYDLNLFKASKAAEAAGWKKDDIDALQTTLGGDRTLNMLLGLAGKMSEADILRGGGTSTGPAMTRDQAIARRAEILVNSSVRKFTPAELEAAQTELRSLAPIIVGPPTR